MARSVLKTRLRVTSSNALRKSVHLAACVAAAALVLAPSEVSAEQIDRLTSSAFSRNNKLRGTSQKPFWINREDCITDDVLHFDVKVTQPSDNNFEVWVGDTNCESPEARTGNVAKMCWQVWGESAPTNSFQVDIKVRDIIAAPDNGGFAKDTGTLADCNSDWASTLGIYFMYVDDTGDISGNWVRWELTGVDIKGPLPPTNVTAGVGDADRLVAKWGSSDSLGLTSYNVYCTEAGAGPAPVVVEGDGGATSAQNVSDPDAGSGTDAGSSDAGLDAAVSVAPPLASTPTLLADAGAGSCWGAGLVPGALPPTGLQPCGTETSRTATHGNATGLIEGTRYALAVAAVDELGNPGVLSNVACGIPEPVTDAFEAYRGSGGGGGGGFCGVATIGQTQHRPLGTLLPLGAAVALGCGSWARRSARRKRTQRVERQS
jgi:hypothetical protein